MASITLQKYHGLGNDFLVLVDLDRSGPFDAALAIALCDRHRGIGGDGLLRLSTATEHAAIKMELRNADGSLAETSGNGLRCAALAALHLELVIGPEVLVETDAGTVTAVICMADDHGMGEVRVEMGALVVVQDEAEIASRRVLRVDAGNPHLVLLGSDLSEVDLAELGPELEASTPGGVNVELVAPRGNGDGLDVITWERGVGLTLACGSGSCAAAAAARFAGLVASPVTVHNPGGALVVELSGNDASQPVAVLIGPAQRVGHITVNLSDLMKEPAVSA